MNHEDQEQSFVIGVDPHPDTHTACVLDTNAKGGDMIPAGNDH